VSNPINPHLIAPTSSRRVGVTFKALRSGEAWSVDQVITWRDRDGWDGEFVTLATGLTEAEARRIVAGLEAVSVRKAA
jgi:hypothetical protein